MISFVILSAVVCAVFGEAPYYSPTYSSVFYQRSVQPPYAPSGYRPNEPQFYFPSLRLQQAPQFQEQPDDPRLAQQPGQQGSEEPRYPQGQGTQDPRFPATLPGQQPPFGISIPRGVPTYNSRQPSDRPTRIPFPNARPRTNPTSTTAAKGEETTTTEEPSTTTELDETTTTVTTNKNATKEVENLEDLEDQSKDDSSSGQLGKSKDELVEEGTYYIYHPSGLLQKVAYNSRNNFAKMDYTAMLKYENVEPIKEPIYTYDPNTYVFSQLTV